MATHKGNFVAGLSRNFDVICIDGKPFRVCYPGFKCTSEAGFAQDSCEYYTDPTTGAKAFGKSCGGSLFTPDELRICGIVDGNVPVDGPGTAPDGNPGEPVDQPPVDGDELQGCCDRIDSGLQAIADAIRNLKLTAEVTVNNSCDTVDRCLSGIRDSAGKCIEDSKLTCEDCCRKLKDGAELTSLEASQCIDCVCDEPVNECSQASDQGEGDSCKGCGQEPCCCKNNTCQPCEEPDKGLQFIGWCNTRTGNVAVTNRNSSPPLPIGEWKQTGFSKTESEALRQAQAACQPNEPTIPPPPGRPSPNPHASILCNDAILGDRNAAATFLAKASESIDQAYILNVQKDAYQEILNYGMKIPGVNAVVAGMMSAITSPIAAAGLMSPEISKVIGCNDPAWQGGLQAMSMLGLFDKWTGASVSNFADQLIYAVNSTCRRKILSPAEATSAWLANSFNDEILDRHWAAFGYCREAVDTFKHASRSRPNANELIRMKFRGLITNDEFSTAMRGNGYTDPSDVSNLFESTKQLPGLSDIIRFMVRDADDNQLATQFGLDSLFDKKYGGQLRKWSEQQGIDERIAQYAWRSHWEIPSPTQLFQFWRRLRYKPEFGGKEKLLTDIKAALVQQDILPFWQDKYLAVAFNPMTRVDTRRAFNIGSMTEKQVKDSYIDQGYSDENADILTKFTVRLRDEAASGNRQIKLWQKFIIDGTTAERRMIDGGLPPEVVKKAMAEVELSFATSYLGKAFARGELPADKLVDSLADHGVSSDGIARILKLLGGSIKTLPVLEQYKAGTLDRIDTGRAATEYGMTAGRIAALMDSVDSKIDARGAMACQKALHQRFLLGELTSEQVENALVGHGITLERTNQLLKWWGCEKKAYGKSIPTNTLCEWNARGSISDKQFADRLEALGYDEVSRHNLIIDCRVRQNIKAQAKATKDAREQAQEDAKQRSRAEKAAKSIQQAAKQLEQQRARAVATKQRRQKQLESAASKFLKRCDCDVSTAMQWATEAKSRIQREYGLDQDETLQAMLISVETWTGIDGDPIDDILNMNAQLAVDKALAQP